VADAMGIYRCVTMLVLSVQMQFMFYMFLVIVACIGFVYSLVML